jgi:hypothetical protein
LDSKMVGAAGFEPLAQPINIEKLYKLYSIALSSQCKIFFGNGPWECASIFMEYLHGILGEPFNGCFRESSIC